MAKSSIIGRGPTSITLPSGGGSDTPEQVRDKLASLTGSNKLESASVYYNDSSSDLGGADDVQEAIDVLDSRIDDFDNNLQDKIYTTENFTLDTFNISTRSVTLSGIPTTPELTNASTGGVVLTFGEDYTISGNTLSWAGLGLDGIAEEGDVLKVVFN